MFKSHTSSTGNHGDYYSRLEQHDEEDEANFGELVHHPNSVLVANHHGQCNVVPPLSQSLQLNTTTSPHHSPPHSPRASFSAATNVTRRFFQTKLPIAFRKDMGNTASFSSLPAVILADLQNGHIPAYRRNQTDEDAIQNDQGWTIVHRRRFRGKYGIGESRHPASTKFTIADEEIDPSDQVTCSVFVKWQETDQVPDQYTMTMSPLFNEPDNKKEQEDRHFNDPIPVTEEKFNEIVESVRIAIENNMQPTRISQGSSGSYFCRNSSGKIVGVFKPKNEEPYGRLNPKWTKWIHRHLFPCFFGRSCLIPNLGYLSEAAASLIDRKLGTMVVPYTDVIHIASSSFHYDYLDRRAQQLPPKIGSFQCFLTDYKDATVFFRDYPYLSSLEDPDSSLNNSRRSVWGGCLGNNGNDFDEDMNNEEEMYGVNEEDDSDHTHVANTPTPTATTFNSYQRIHDHTANIPSITHQPNARPTKQQQKNINGKQPEFKWTRQLQKQFRREFEQLIILDYLIRNTDRGLDNWMIKYCPPTKDAATQCTTATTTSSSSSNSSSKRSCVDPKYTTNHNSNKGHIHVAAIDNGLAFPYKHPDQWRSYPYGWIAMPDALINRPFSEPTRKQFLNILSDPLWWRDTVRDMRHLFELDDDFDERMFQKQMAVLKGQGFNIVRTLSNPSAGPVDLVAMQRVVVRQEEILIEYDERALQTRDQRFTSTSQAIDMSDALNNNSKTKKSTKQRPRKLRTQRSTSFDVSSITSASFHRDYGHQQEEEEDVGLMAADYFPSTSHTTNTSPLPQQRHQQQQQKRWRDKIKNGLSMDLHRKGGGLFGKRRQKPKKNRYRAFDSDGDISDGEDSGSETDDDEPKLKRVTVVMETIEVVKSRTYFTCC